MFMLDTNILSDFIRNPNGVVGSRIIATDDIPITTSVVVAGELRFGAELRRSSRLANQVEDVLSLITILPLEPDADVRYAVLRADLQRRGLPIGANDMLIAAHAFSLDATLVTDNVREFARVEGLTIENWLRD